MDDPRRATWSSVMKFSLSLLMLCNGCGRATSMKGVLAKKTRSLQNCISNPDTLRDRLQNSFSGEKIYVCSGTMDVPNEIAISTSSVTLSCVGAARSCTLKGADNDRILTVTGSSFALEGIVLKNGRSSGNGGAVLLGGGGSNRVVNCLFDGNTASANGGALFCEKGTVSIQNTRFENNDSSGQGGAASIPGLFETIANSGANNRAVQCDEFYLQNSGTCQSFKLEESIPIPAPVFSPVAAPVRAPVSAPTIPPPVPTAGPPTSRTCISTYNDLNNRLLSVANGDSVSMCSGTITVAAEMIITANSVTLSCFESSGSCILSKSSSQNGRILEVQGNSVTLDGISFRNAYNTEGDGGAVAILGEGSHTVRKCDFRNNQSSGYGGGLWVTNESDSSRFFMSGCRFSNNRSASNGGGLTVRSVHDVNMQNNDFDENSSSSGAGGFFLSHVSIIRITGGNVSNNQATGGAGGGTIITYSNDAVVDGVLYSANTSGNNAGALRSYFSNINVRNCNFRHNLANGHSGGVSMEGDGTEKFLGSVSNTRFESNEAKTKYGGGLSIQDMPNSTVASSRFFYNRAPSDKGGAAYVTVLPASSAAIVGSDNYAEGCNDVYVNSTQSCFQVQQPDSASSSVSAASSPSSYGIQSDMYTVEMKSSSASNTTTATARMGTNETTPVFSNDTGVEEYSTLRDLSLEERQRLIPAMVSHLKAKVQESLLKFKANTAILKESRIRISNVGLDDQASSTTVFSGQFYFDNVAFSEDGVPLTSTSLGEIILAAFTQEEHGAFLLELKNRFGQEQTSGRLGRVVSFVIVPYGTEIDSQDDDAIIPLEDLGDFGVSSSSDVP